MDKEEKFYKRTGAITLLIILVLIIGIQSIDKKRLFNKPNNLFLLIENASGIKKGDLVKVDGVNSGSIKSIELNEGKILIEIRFDREIAIRNDAKFSISQSSLFGNSRIEIENAKLGKTFQQGDTINPSLISKSIFDNIDTTIINQFEPTLKKLSREIGKALHEYGESKDSVNND